MLGYLGNLCFICSNSNDLQHLGTGVVRIMPLLKTKHCLLLQNIEMNGWITILSLNLKWRIYGLCLFDAATHIFKKKKKLPIICHMTSSMTPASTFPRCPHVLPRFVCTALWFAVNRVLLLYVRPLFVVWHVVGASYSIKHSIKLDSLITEFK